MDDFEKIKQAVLTNCGGFESASDDEIRIKWNSLPADIQKKYLNDVKGKANEKD
jgi:hypothetical protein